MIVPMINFKRMIMCSAATTIIKSLYIPSKESSSDEIGKLDFRVLLVISTNNPLTKTETKANI